jgi:uncharacterized protein YneF (UPF0154 family)
MPWTEAIVTISIVCALALGFIALLRLGGTLITHRTLRKAVETSPQLSDELVAKLTARRERPGAGDEKLAIVLVAIGLAMVAAPIIAIDDPGIVRFAVGAALFPLLVGGALWLRFRAAERAKRRDGGQ